MSKIALFAALIFAVVLPSCVSSTFNMGMPALLGENIETGLDIFGLPESKMEFGKDTIYMWKFTGGPATQGTIRARVDSAGTIKSLDANGNNGALAQPAIDLLNYSTRKKKLQKQQLKQQQQKAAASAT